jgi:chromate transport protein ChrA
MAEPDKNITQEEAKQFETSIYYTLHRVVMAAIIILFASNYLGIIIDICKLGTTYPLNVVGFILLVTVCSFVFIVFALPGAIIMVLFRTIFQKLLYRKNRKTIALIITIISVAICLQHTYYFGMNLT